MSEQPAAGFTATDHRLMAHALRLAERGAYTARPNPMVGCVLAREGEIVGEGWHRRAGEAHAEVLALQAAGKRARGATAYVTLEPCAHAGKTGPCAGALVEAGVARVVVAMRDPFDQVDGAGLETLRQAGVVVETGLMEAQARELNRGFVSRVVRGRPWLRLKLASSLDGRSALANGDSKWISGETSRADVQRWRAQSGAILTGAGTIMADDPSLTVRLASDIEVAAPLRVVLDPGLATISRGRVREGDAPTLYVHAPDVKLPREMAADHAHIDVEHGHFDLRAVLRLLAERGINEVQAEAGATLAGSFLAAGLVDELLLYVAPVVLGAGARPLFAGMDVTDMADALRLELVETRPLGTDVRLLLRPRSE